MVGLLDHATAAVMAQAPGIAPPPVESAPHRFPTTSETTLHIAALERELFVLRGQASVHDRARDHWTESMASAGALHRNLCTTDVPGLRGATIEAHFRPTEAVGGDAYQIVRLDEHRVAIGMIDATGHGVSGSLLAAYTQQAMANVFREAALDSSCVPCAMMAQLNRALCHAALPDCQFVAAVIAIYDERVQSLSLARAGIPYPVHLRRTSAPEVINLRGPLLGTVPDARYENTVRNLAAGETVVFFTDGLETALACADDPPVTDVANTQWIQSLRDRDLSEACREIEVGSGTRPDEDDVTVIVLRVG